MLLLLIATAIAIGTQVQVELLLLFGVVLTAAMTLLPWGFDRRDDMPAGEDELYWQASSSLWMRLAGPALALGLMVVVALAERYGRFGKQNQGMPIRYMFSVGMVAAGWLAYLARPRRFHIADRGLWVATAPLFVFAGRGFAKPRRLFSWTDVVRFTSDRREIRIEVRRGRWPAFLPYGTSIHAIPVSGEQGGRSPEVTNDTGGGLIGSIRRRCPGKEQPEPAQSSTPDLHAHWRPILLVFAVVALVSNLPFVMAEYFPPPGKVFVGTFAYTEDYLNYLAHAQQAEDGGFLLRNKYYAYPHAASYINLEWWVVGLLSRLLGRHPELAYRMVDLAMLFFLVLLIDRWLRRGGLPKSHRIAALVLVISGAGLGGLRFVFQNVPLFRCMDLLAGLFPVIEILYNPHFVVGTTLLLWCLELFGDANDGRGLVRATVVGTVAGLVRPYELVTLIGTYVIVTVASTAPRLWLRRLIPVLGLVPVLVFNVFALMLNPAFAFTQSPRYGMPPGSRFVLALAPALLLAVTALWLPRGDETSRRYRMLLAAWLALGTSMIAAPPFLFTAQVLVGIGLPCLMLAALGLSRWRPGVTWTVAALMCTTGLVALHGMLAGPDTAFARKERWQVALAAREPCRQGGILLSPADIGLYVGALTACSPIISHSTLRDAPTMREQVASLFSTSDQARWRTFLAKRDVTHMALPADVAVRAQQALGPDSPFQELGTYGSGADSLVLLVRHPG